LPIVSYIKDPDEIYRRSFAIVEQEAHLGHLPGDMHGVAVRIIHACGMVDIASDIAASSKAVEAGRSALASGCSIFCDVEMVQSGIIGRFLSAGNELICTLKDEKCASHAKAIGNTRSAAGVDLWDERLAGAIVVIGNAPTALFRLLERLDEGAPSPALILGFPVGFVGAMESKLELEKNPRGCEFITLRGRRGGSAIAAAAFNAISKGVRDE